MTWDTQRRRAFIRHVVKDRIATEGGIPRIQVIDEIVATLADEEHDLEQVLRAEVISIYDSEARSREQGMRRTEVTYDGDGERVDAAPEQLTFFQLEQAAMRKRSHGEASINEADMDLAVAAVGRKRCKRLGVDPARTIVGSVLTRDEILAIRRGELAA